MVRLKRSPEEIIDNKGLFASIFCLKTGTLYTNSLFIIATSSKLIYAYMFVVQPKCTGHSRIAAYLGHAVNRRLKPVGIVLRDCVFLSKELLSSFNVTLT